jgi:hypothetical protein
MSYNITLAGDEIEVTLSQVGQQGIRGPSGADGLGVVWVGAWATSTTYGVNDTVSSGGSSYVCVADHTSEAATEPGQGASWETVWDLLAAKGADGSGAGTVTSINITAGDGILASGGPVTSSGSITVSLDTDFVETTTLNAQTGTTYTLALTDRGQTVTMDSASANTVTIPTNATVAFDSGSVVTVIMKGAGTTTITGATGVTVNGASAGSVSISAQYQGVSLLKVGTNEWIASGALA